MGTLYGFIHIVRILSYAAGTGDYPTIIILEMTRRRSMLFRPPCVVPRPDAASSLKGFPELDISIFGKSPLQFPPRDLGCAQPNLANLAVAVG